MITFCHPCLNWKLLSAFKSRPGYPGFIDRTAAYLKRVESYTFTVLGNPAPPVVQTFTKDRVTGADTVSPSLQFPSPINVYPLTDPRWKFLTDDHATISIPDPSGVITNNYDVQLSNPYTLAQLEAEVDALLGSVDPATVTQMTLKHLVMPGEVVLTLPAEITNILPGAYIYANVFAGVSAQPVLKAAAVAAFAPQISYAGQAFAGGLWKLKSLVALAGDYCQRTFDYDYAGKQIGQPQCISGKGACNAWFPVNPPPFTPDQNTLRLIIPDCQCI